MNKHESFAAPDVELRLIAALCRNPQLYYSLSDCVSPRVFEQHKEVFNRFVNALHSERINDLPRLDEIAPSRNPADDALLLSKLFKKRLTKLMMEKANEKLSSEAGTAEQVLGFLGEESKKVEQSIRTTGQFRIASLASQSSSILDFAKAKQTAAKGNNGLVGLPTSLPTLDRLLGGFQPGLHFLSAQPGIGKTTLALQISRKVAEKRFPVIYLTYEQSPDILGLRVICSHYGLHTKNYMDGRGDCSMLEKKIAEAKLSGWTENIYIIEGTAKTTVSSLKSFCNAILAKHNMSRCLIVIDYLQRWARALPSHKEFRLDVSALSSDLRTLSTSLDSPVIAIASQNRGGKEEASMSRLRESGDLEFDGDSIIFLTNQTANSNEHNEERNLCLSLVKNRFGNTGVCQIVFRPDTGDFYEQSNRSPY